MTTSNLTNNWFNCPSIEATGFYGIHAKVIINGYSSVVKMPAVEISDISKEAIEKAIIYEIARAKRMNIAHDLQHVTVTEINFKMPIRK